ncbi:MAG: BMP family ABC transporter substrate-binding protein [Spiroplasma poulsonii]|uniref:Basic membrane protein n=1 Tax=Spiroplasma poulsonii TaxID=2138 RepID=A0A2P6FBR8_9MOLU|nr:BMP family ABC transporter substrate-binding protein [Spiroplasma poulsonii]KAF0851282.1 Basic membrane protein [Spiroplasma poulsonii]MBW1241644.1 BMP family ABC transporter substrate-binding protein [Spiroplasma poulsonii]PQM30876.1 Basic membrane protein [Spiroplasma poulsonii]PWF95869.1 Basic membrane protein [Spiroplasma poulsonii]PWF98646.1 Basic membrane protein [Spiroplasma poulsonii]
MKKLMKFIMALQIVIPLTSFLTACLKKHQYMSNIWVISSSTINDKSFNQSAWEGASRYLVTHSEQSVSSNWQDSNIRASYFEPVGLTPAEFKTAYITASIAGAKTLILPGFIHGNTIGWAATLANNIIFIDGSGQNIHKNMDQKESWVDNVVGILFQKEIAGFLAGLVTAMWLNLHQTQFNGQLGIGTYGGMDNPIGVSNYLWGFLLSADIFNEIINNNSLYPNLHHLKQDILTLLQGISPTLKGLQPINKVQTVLNKNESWFSQSFNQGDGKVISDYLISKQANVIFPVAGPQTQDTIDRIKYNEAKAKVVGVDTAQAEIYGDQYIITSGLLNIAQATEDALINIYSPTCGYQTDSKIWDAKKATNKCWINTDQSSSTNANWLGVEKTKWIDSKIINYIRLLAIPLFIKILL